MSVIVSGHLIVIEHLLWFFMLHHQPCYSPNEPKIDWEIQKKKICETPENHRNYLHKSDITFLTHFCFKSKIVLFLATLHWCQSQLNELLFSLNNTNSYLAQESFSKLRCVTYPMKAACLKGIVHPKINNACSVVNGCRQNESLVKTCTPLQSISSCEVKSCVFVIKKIIIMAFTLFKRSRLAKIADHTAKKKKKI